MTRIQRNMHALKRIKYRWTAIAICLISAFPASGQDVHLSQFILNPMTYNPGNTGMANTDLRSSLSYRNQWAGIAAFTTYKASIDGHIKVKKNSGVLLTLGACLYKDVAGDHQMGTFNANLFAGSIVPLNPNNDISVGISAGFFQNSIVPGTMIWDNQYVNGQYNPALPSGEILDFSPSTSPDFGAGVTYRYRRQTGNLFSNDNFSMRFGMGVMHLNRPHIGFSQTEDRLPVKISAQGDATVGLVHTNLGFRPGFFFSRQGLYQEMVAGTYWSALLREASRRTGFIYNTRFSLGTHYRVGDAFIPSILWEVSGYKLGVSYDVNVSGLTRATAGKGGVEITFVYTNPPVSYYKKKRRRGKIFF